MENCKEGTNIGSYTTIIQQSDPRSLLNAQPSPPYDGCVSWRHRNEWLMLQDECIQIPTCWTCWIDMSMCAGSNPWLHQIQIVIGVLQEEHAFPVYLRTRRYFTWRRRWRCIFVQRENEGLIFLFLGIAFTLAAEFSIVCASAFGWAKWQWIVIICAIIQCVCVFSLHC